MRKKYVTKWVISFFSVLSIAQFGMNGWMFRKRFFLKNITNILLTPSDLAKLFVVGLDGVQIRKRLSYSDILDIRNSILQL